MEHLSNDRKDCPNQRKDSHKQCDETEHSVGNVMESQRELRQQHDQNFPMEGKPFVKRILEFEEIKKSNRAGL